MNITKSVKKLSIKKQFIISTKKYIDCYMIFLDNVILKTTLIKQFVCFFFYSTLPHPPRAHFLSLIMSPVKLQIHSTLNCRLACLPWTQEGCIGQSSPLYDMPFEQPYFHLSSPVQLHCSKQTQFVMQDFTFPESTEDFLSILINFFALLQITPEASMCTAPFWLLLSHGVESMFEYWRQRFNIFTQVKLTSKYALKNVHTNYCFGLNLFSWNQNNSLQTNYIFSLLKQKQKQKTL